MFQSNFIKVAYGSDTIASFTLHLTWWCQPSHRSTQVYMTPEEATSIDLACPFVLTESGENICKASIDIVGDPSRRVMILTTKKVLELGLLSSPCGVMDATLDESSWWFNLSHTIVLLILRAVPSCLANYSWCLVTLERCCGDPLCMCCNLTSTRIPTREPFRL